MNESRNAITGGILAGGKASRFDNTDKAFVLLDGKPLIEHVIHRLAPQVRELLISANRHADQYHRWGIPVFPDAPTSPPGPLAGIARLLEQTQTEYLLVTPCDLPFLPQELGTRLFAALRQHQRPAAVAHDGRRQQHLCLLLHQDLHKALHRFLATGDRAVHRWLAEVQPAQAVFPDSGHAFTNINTPSDLQQAQCSAQR